ncbi:hypothetical protein JHK87_045048 [Glycine soja]|nr:hypothetical protein JHK87_045048 [Glycine soja]
MILPIVQPLSFNITNFSDPEIASRIQCTGIAKIENGNIVLNPLINNGVERAIYGQPLRLKNPSNGNTPLAFDYQTPPNFSGFSLGLYGGTLDNIVAVEFDTYINEYDQPMHRVGINNNSVASLEYKKFHIESNIGKMGTSSGFTPNDSLSHQIDLREILPKWVTVEFSGATRSSKEENVIHSWEFSTNLDLNINDN